MWHRDFPPDAREMWDVIAKALMLRAQTSAVHISGDELRQAADTQAEIELHDDGSIGFRKERQ
jgi:hypothetical protein